ncbi:hypothetical protein B484DRAFT_461281, partial [Ochromonadaceae sp. CCMP2298]
WFTGDDFLIRKSALRDLLLGLRSRSVICEDLGIDEKTVTALKDRFVSHFSDTVSSLASLKESFKRDPAQLDSLLAVFPLPAMGPSFYIPELSNHVIANIATRRKSAGYGLDRQALGLQLYQGLAENRGNLLAAELAQASSSSQLPSDPAALRRVTRLQDAVCGKKYVTQNAAVRNAKEGNGVGRFTKDSNISEKRAAAANPIYDSIMKAEFLRVFNDHRDKGILQTDLPLASQVIP